jgi:flagellar basal-body rod protein FlgF
MTIAMDPLTAIAASGLRARMESLELLANNIANASTGGYKADREFYSLYVAPDVDEALSTMPVIERPWIDLSQGTIYSTGNPLDVALSGQGFLAVDGPSGPLYTRSGSLHVAPDGRLATAEGYPVRSEQGNPITIDPTLPVKITEDGTIRQEGSVVGRLAVVDFSTTAGLAKQGQNYFRVAAPTLRPSPAGSVSVEQGKLEASNTGSAEAAVRLVSVMRQFEMLQRAVSLGGEMNRRAVEEVAKVGS